MVIPIQEHIGDIMTKYLLFGLTNSNPVATVTTLMTYRLVRKLWVLVNSPKEYKKKGR
jgi:hypothetical protein